MQDGALQALGLLFAARPALMQSPEVAALMRAVLQPSAPAAFKTRLLSSLADLLRARRCIFTIDLLSCSASTTPICAHAHGYFAACRP